MNIQHIFEAVKSDESNSALGIITAELERQGYIVNINNTAVTSKKFFSGELDDLERNSNNFVFLISDGDDTQEFSIEFTDYHEIKFKEAVNNGSS